jgi:DNA-binding MarR family transcriptional regulator
VRPTPEIKPLHSVLGEICHLHHTQIDTAFEEMGLYRGQPQVLMYLLQNDGCTQTELGTMRNVKPATISKVLQRMDHAGFVERRADLEDQRVSRVYLTPAGHAICEDVQKTLDALDEETFGDFSLEERVLLRRFFAQIRENLLTAT